MRAVVRAYSGHGARALLDLLERRKDEVERAMRGVPGFLAYLLVRTGDGGLAVTVCRDQAGTDASLKLAADWVKENAADLGLSPPVVTEGDVILRLG
jgi:hypothetical protein